jgi:hypothetical protein
MVSLMAALISAFMRIDRLSLKKGKIPTAADASTEKETTEPDATPASTEENPNNTSSTAAKRIPAPVRPKSKSEENKKIALKASKKPDKETTPEPEVAAMEDLSKSESTAQTESKRTIPVKPISEAQKDTIRNRLNRKDLLVKPAPLDESVSNVEKLSSLEQKPLSAAEIRAKLAARLEQTRAANGKLNGSEKPANNEANKPIQNDKAGVGIKLSKPTPEPVDEEPSDEAQNTKAESGAAKKLSLPNR